MGNSPSLDSRSVCCISLESSTLSDDNTLKMKKVSDERTPASNPHFTPEEKAALQSSFKAAPNTIKIENENSFSSISSASSSKSSQLVKKHQKKKKKRLNKSIKRNRNDIVEMRNDYVECDMVAGDEERAGISHEEDLNYDEGADDSYYYSAGSSRSRRHSRDLHYRNLIDERRE